MTNSKVCLRSPLGLIQIEAGAKGVRSVRFLKRSVSSKSGVVGTVLRKCMRELDEYFKGRRTRFTVSLDLKGTPFQKKVWSQITRIPCGQTITYRELARRAGNIRAARAAGTATGSNPACILVPCHRIVAAKGLGGYAYGIRKKKGLLSREGVRSHK